MDSENLLAGKRCKYYADSDGNLARLSRIRRCRVWLAVAPGAAVLALAPAQPAGEPRLNDQQPRVADTRLDRTPPRQTKGLRLVKLGWTYNCMECHTLLPAKWHYDRPMVEHQDIRLEHGENRFCLNCHHPVNRNAFVDYDGSEIAEGNVVLVCAKCHGPTYRDWQAGAHGRRNGYWDTAKGPQTRLRCIQCHDPHQPKFQPMAPLAPLRYPPRAPHPPAEPKVGNTEHVTPQSLVGPPRRGGQKTALSARAPHPTEGLPEHTPHTARLASPGALPQHRTMGNLSATEAVPLLLWRRGTGRGGRLKTTYGYWQNTACFKAEPMRTHSLGASSPRPSPPKEEREKPSAPRQSSKLAGSGGEEAPDKLARPGSVLEEAVFCRWPEVVIKPESRSSPGEISPDCLRALRPRTAGRRNCSRQTSRQECRRYGRQECLRYDWPVHGEGTRPTGNCGFRVKTASSPLPSPPEEERASHARTRVTATQSSERGSQPAAASIQHPASSIEHPASPTP